MHASVQPRTARALLDLTFIMSAGLFVEVYTAMNSLLGQSGHPWAWVPVIFLPVAIVLTVLLQLFPGERALLGFQITMGLAVGVGVVGTVLHLGAHGLLGGGVAYALSFNGWLGDPPIFAPMSFGVLGVLGWFATAAGLEVRGGRLVAPALTAAAGLLALVGMLLDIFQLGRVLGLLLTMVAVGLEVVILALEWLWQGASVEEPEANRQSLGE
jgi:hypothetical protein